MLEDFKDWLINTCILILFVAFMLGFLIAVFMLVYTGHLILAFLVFVIGIGVIGN